MPKGTHSQMPLHWHPSGRPGCLALKCIEGPLHIYCAQGPEGSYDRLVNAPGYEMKFKPGQRIAFNCSRRDKTTRASLETVKVGLTADTVLWRNVCSAILDRDRFPGLTMTPYWLKALFGLLALLLPQSRERLLSGILWVQIQAMFYAHDFHVFHGYVPVIRPWTAQPFGGHAPPWAYKAQLWSMQMVSWAVMGACYWGGRLFCGISGEYDVYTPLSRDAREDMAGTGE